MNQDKQLELIYEAIVKKHDPHIEAPFTKEDMFKTRYELDVRSSVRHLPNRSLDKSYIIYEGDVHTTYQWYIKGARKHRDERDEKTGLSLPAYIEIDRRSGIVTQLSWFTNNGGYRVERDPSTGGWLPCSIQVAFKRTGGHEVQKIWTTVDGFHRTDGPAIECINYLTGEVTSKQYALHGNLMNEEEWLKDPLVQREFKFKKLEDKETKDDDFLRTFGDIL